MSEGLGRPVDPQSKADRYFTRFGSLPQKEARETGSRVIVNTEHTRGDRKSSIYIEFLSDGSIASPVSRYMSSDPLKGEAEVQLL